MFCANCGQPVKDEWVHCVACGEVIEEIDDFDEDEIDDETDDVWEYNCPEQEARDYLTEIEYDHWRACGMPTLRFREDDLVGFAFDSDSSQWYDFIRFALHNLNEEDFEDWVSRKCPLLSHFDGFTFTYQPDTELLTPFQVSQRMENPELQTWEAIGRPQMRINADGRWFLSSALNVFLWREATVPISDDRVAEILSALE